MYGKISRVVKARITRVPQARVQYGALTTSGILPYMYAFDNIIFIICRCVKRNADSAVRCSSKSSVLVLPRVAYKRQHTIAGRLSSR